jgi:IS30 family transposase
MRAPYVCNACEKKGGCRRDKYYYRAQISYDEYREELVSARAGINLDQEELYKVDALLSPLIKAGQPISHIYAYRGHEIPFCKRTLYNHVANHVLSVKSHDLARKVRYKPRKKHKQPAKDRAYRIGRTFSDFGRFMALNPDVRIVEMDTVIGAQSASSNVLLTMLFRWLNLMLVFLMPDKSQDSVKAVFDKLIKDLGSETFKEIFPLFLTDNGSEFMNWQDYLTDEHGELLSEIFFCDANASYQKGRIEKNHEYLRYILPKGTSFENLTDEKVILIMNHINSTARPSLGGETPMGLSLKLLPTEFFVMLGLKGVKPEKVQLTPSLIKTL